MPNIHGIELLKKIKAHPVYKNISVVMLSTTIVPNENEVANELGVHIVVKPTSYQELSVLAGTLLKYCGFNLVQFVNISINDQLQ